MIDIPLNKALAAVERKTQNCDDCYLQGEACFSFLVCNAAYRKDSRNVVFRLVDLPGEGNNGTAGII